MVFDWEAFQPIEKPSIDEMMRMDMVYEFIMDMSGEEFHFIVISMLGPLENWECALIFCTETQSLNTIQPKES